MPVPYLDFLLFHDYDDDDDTFQSVPPSVQLSKFPGVSVAVVENGYCCEGSAVAGIEGAKDDHEERDDDDYPVHFPLFLYPAAERTEDEDDDDSDYAHGDGSC